jgi:hypothetical protein
MGRNGAERKDSVTNHKTFDSSRGAAAPSAATQKEPMQPTRSFAALAVIAAGVLSTQAQYLVYNNGVNYSGLYLNPGLSEVGDQIILSSPDVASSFAFEYFGSMNYSGDEQFRIRFYLNDGLPSGFPNSVFYDSGLQSLAQPTDPTGRSTYTIDLTSLNLALPSSFTWSVQFSGVSGAEIAGPVIYSPPTVGGNFDDYWFNNAGAWELRSSNGVPISFGAQIAAVPEPSTYVLAILGGLCGFALVARRRNRQ